MRTIDILFYFSFIALVVLTIVGWVVPGYSDIAKACSFGLVGIILGCIAKDNLRKRNKEIEQHSFGCKGDTNEKD